MRQVEAIKRAHVAEMASEATERFCSAEGFVPRDSYREPVVVPPRHQMQSSTGRTPHVVLPPRWMQSSAGRKTVPLMPRPSHFSPQSFAASSASASLQDTNWASATDAAKSVVALTAPSDRTTSARRAQPLWKGVLHDWCGGNMRELDPARGGAEAIGSWA